MTRAEKLEQQSPIAAVPNVFEIVAVIGLRLSRFPYFHKRLMLMTTNQRDIATLAGGFFFCTLVDCIINYAIFGFRLIDWME
jgi:hypothetical protein